MRQLCQSPVCVFPPQMSADRMLMLANVQHRKSAEVGEYSGLMEQMEDVHVLHEQVFGWLTQRLFAEGLKCHKVFVFFFPL